MKTNMGTTDRILRMAVAAMVVILFAFQQISRKTALVLLVLPAIFITTSFIRFCPIY